MERAYEQLVEDRARYKSQLVKIPVPEFYTFYNGTEEYPLEQELSLSDAFLSPAAGNSAELKVKVININSSKAHRILQECGGLGEYSQFIDTIRRHAHEEDPIRAAINECISKGILSDYLKRKGSEMRNMLMAEYSYEEDMRVKQEEAMQIGEKRGLQQGVVLSGQIFQAIKRKPDLENGKIAEEIGCTVEEVESVRGVLGI